MKWILRWWRSINVLTRRAERTLTTNSSLPLSGPHITREFKPSQHLWGDSIELSRWLKWLPDHTSDSFLTWTLEGQSGIMLNLNHCLQMGTTMVTVFMDKSFKLSWGQEGGRRLGSSIRTLVFKRAGFSLSRELLRRMRWKGTMSREVTKQSRCGYLRINNSLMQKDCEFYQKIKI